MNKKNYFVTFLQKFNLSINSLLEKYLNKLKFIKLSNIVNSNKALLIFVALIIFFLSYISIPHIYNKLEVKTELENQLFNKFNINFNFPKNFNYNFFPRPHFTVEDSSIVENQIEISEIKRLRIYVSLNNLFSLKKIIIKDVILENTNFNLNTKNSDFFLKILDNNFLATSFVVKNSNIFFRNIKDEVLFINKIINMKYYYDPKELKNIIKSKNEIFNIPYHFTTHKDGEKIFFSKINFNSIKFKIENIFDYTNDKKKGLINFILQRSKSKGIYEIDKNNFIFNYYDKLSDPNFIYNIKINFNPFFSNIVGKNDELNISYLFNSNNFFLQILKTEIFNNKNLNIDFAIKANQITNYENLINLSLNSKIQEGLIDIDNTTFSWSDYAHFEISDSLLYTNQNQLILDCNLLINVKKYNDIYKFLQISKNLRPVLEKIELNFSYNFDEKIMKINNIQINDNNSTEVNNAVKKIIFKKDRLQNKIYLKNLIRRVMKAYVG